MRDIGNMRVVGQCRLGDKDVRVEVPVRLGEEFPFMVIRVEGYGDNESMDGCGSPLVLEVAGGRLRAVIWRDINSVGDPMVVDLEGAREKMRKDE